MPDCIVNGAVGGFVIAAILALLDVRKGRPPGLRSAIEIVLTFVVVSIGAGVGVGLLRMGGSESYLQYSPQEWFVGAVVSGVFCVGLLVVLAPSSHHE